MTLVTSGLLPSPAVSVNVTDLTSPVEPENSTLRNLIAKRKRTRRRQSTVEDVERRRISKFTNRLPIFDGENVGAFGSGDSDGASHGGGGADRVVNGHFAK